MEEGRIRRRLAELTVIRPLLFVYESDVIGFKNKYDLPISKNPCPADGNTKREYMKDLIKDLSKDIPKIKPCVFGAITRSGIKGWDKPSVKNFEKDENQK